MSCWAGFPRGVHPMCDFCPLSIYGSLAPCHFFFASLCRLVTVLTGIALLVVLETIMLGLEPGSLVPGQPASSQKVSNKRAQAGFRALWRGGVGNSLLFPRAKSEIDERGDTRQMGRAIDPCRCRVVWVDDGGGGGGAVYTYYVHSSSNGILGQFRYGALSTSSSGTWGATTTNVVGPRSVL